jgi:hypothetical protein
MKYTVIKLTAPSTWATYLINGDASGLEPHEKAMADAWLDREGLGIPASCEDAGFCWTHDAFIECPLGTDCEEYSFLVKA